ncbi:MAG: hypothetical protein H6907_19470 [Hyphomicrobiales bacterium]|nr:hypothetical protein [Hyphomicrobiales bacterium]MCP5373917.1 hypothetical protein [Hyphomicrobiales bacterium]
MPPSVNHEKVVRFLVLGGEIDAERFCAWIAPEAETRSLDGWVRGRGAGVDVFLAGAEFAVDALFFLCEQVVGAADGTVESRDPRGDEPLWSGFHQLPPL